MRSARIEAVTASIAAHATYVVGISDTLKSLAKPLNSSSGAAAHTPADGAYDHAVHAWIATIGAYGDRTDELATALTLAAYCYVAADRLPGPKER